MNAKLINSGIEYNIEINEEPLYRYEYIKNGNISIAQGSYKDLIFTIKSTKKKIVLKNFTDFKIKYSEKLCYNFKSCKLANNKEFYEINIGLIETL